MTTVELYVVPASPDPSKTKTGRNNLTSLWDVAGVTGLEPANLFIRSEAL